jgi:hypothetical protein
LLRDEVEEQGEKRVGVSEAHKYTRFGSGYDAQVADDFSFLKLLGPFDKYYSPI